MRSAGEFVQANRRYTVVAALALSFLFPTTATSAWLGLYADEAGSGCILPNPPVVGLVHVWVVLKGTSGSSGAQFIVTPPNCSSYQLGGFEAAPGFLSLGDPESGIKVSLAGCQSGDFPVLRLDYIKTNETSDCCGVWTAPHPESVTGSVETLDCAFNPQAIAAKAIWFRGDDTCAPMPAPSDPSPADGATDVPLNVMLNCSFHDENVVFSTCVPLFGDWVSVYFGTDPDPPLATPFGQFPMPRTLAPGTTYHWRVKRQFGPAQATSPVWSFTTTATTAVATSTWGAVKALYR